jgi:diguanylate cyclase (GGDEF)-like protein/PAS domain S-box-containing protein
MQKELHVLLVDDDEDEYVLMKEMFAALPGQERSPRYFLDWASSFEEALLRCKERQYDLHLVDYHLGQYNGLELMRAAREEGCGAPSILLTGQGSYELDLAAMEEGVYDYLLKDQVNEVLLERTLRYALERRQAEEDLERRVLERTQALAEANDRLGDANRELQNEILRRTLAEEVLRESETRFRALADTTSAAIFIVQDGSIRYANPAARFVTGYEPEELFGAALWKLAHPSYQEALRQHRMVSRWAADLPARYEIKLIHKDGGERWVDLTAGEMEFEGRPAWVFTAFDITERDLAEQALRSARDELEERVAQRTDEIQAASQRLTAILRTLPVGMVIADERGRVIDGNEALFLLWDAPDDLPEEMEEWPPLASWWSETGERFDPRDWLAQRTVLQGETILARMADIETLTGDRKTVLYSAAPITGEDGGILGGVAVIQDITRQRHLEQQAQQRADELEGLHRATAALLTTLDLDELLCQILDAAQSAIPAAEKGMLHLVSPTTGQLQVRATLGFSDTRICVIHSADAPGYPARVARERRPLLIADARADAAGADDIPGEMRDARSLILAPLYYGDTVLGTLSLSADQPNAFSDVNLRLLASFAATTTAALQNAILHAEIKQLAITDPLTGEYNRRAFFDLGQRELDRFLRFRYPLAAIMIDLDSFKEVNDTFGHVVGDQILRSLAERCKASIRETDIFGRYGGDEFALLLPDTDLETARSIAVRIREAVLHAPWLTEEGALPVTVSLGVAEANRGHRVLEDLLADADRALYIAKTHGRNRVEVLEVGSA